MVLDFDRLPSKKYLLILLYALNPKHKLFKIEPDDHPLMEEEDQPKEI